MMFLLQPYYDDDRGVLDHVPTRVSRGWPRFRGPPGTPDLRTDHDGRLALVESSHARLLLALGRCGLLALGRCGPLVRTLQHPAERGLGSTNAPAFAPAFHDPTAPAMNCPEAVGQGVQDRPRHGCRGRAPKEGFTACPARPGPPTHPRISEGANALHDRPPKTRRARDLEDLAPGWDRRGREDPPIPFLRGNALTSGSASSRSRSGAPGCPAAARSPAGGPGRRRSCRPNGRTPGWPCRWQGSSASCAPG